MSQLGGGERGVDLLLPSGEAALDVGGLKPLGAQPGGGLGAAATGTAEDGDGGTRWQGVGQRGQLAERDVDDMWAGERAVGDFGGFADIQHQQVWAGIFQQSRELLHGDGGDGFHGI